MKYWDYTRLQKMCDDIDDLPRIRYLEKQKQKVEKRMMKQRELAKSLKPSSRLQDIKLSLAEFEKDLDFKNPVTTETIVDQSSAKKLLGG